MIIPIFVISFLTTFFSLHNLREKNKTKYFAKNLISYLGVIAIAILGLFYADTTSQNDISALLDILPTLIGCIIVFTAFIVLLNIIKIFLIKDFE